MPTPSPRPSTPVLLPTASISALRPGQSRTNSQSGSTRKKRQSPAPPPPPTLNLPVISFRIIEEEEAYVGKGKGKGRTSNGDAWAKGYGYIDPKEYSRPEHYIRHIEPIESELKNQVEYDMDEQDQAWIDQLNNERRKAGSDHVSYELFEIIMDRFEKEWFDLSKMIPKPKDSLPSEDSPCEVCDDGEGENSNAIVFCDGCNLAVHQDCYGVPYIPEGQWLCRKCTVSPENPVSCILCPAEGGAFKQTTAGHWAHLLCAIWTPEVVVGNPVYMEPIDGISNIAKARWKLNCVLCNDKSGSCIQCMHPKCFDAWHVTCARDAHLLGSMKTNGEDGGDGVLEAYCKKHIPSDWEQNFPDPACQAAAIQNSKTKKSARAYAKTYNPPPPLAPAKILDSVTEYLAKAPGKTKKKDLVEKVGRYWSLKREARRGAPLLKRLHLEPWTSRPMDRPHTEEEKGKKLEYLTRIRNDLEKVRMLAELVRKREKEKLRQAQVIKDVLDMILFPHQAALRSVFEKVTALDKSEVFLYPVSKDEYPDYYDVVETAMSWSIIDDKLERQKYRNVQEFKDDVMLTLKNAMTYNRWDNSVHRLAGRIKKPVLAYLAELDHIQATFNSRQLSLLNDPEPPDSPVGDLLPSSSLVSLLQPSAQGVSDPISALFDYYVERTPSPASPFPSTQPPSLSPPASSSAPPAPPAPIILKKSHKKAPRLERVDSSPGFKAPIPPLARSTRASRTSLGGAGGLDAPLVAASSSSQLGSTEPALNRRPSTRVRLSLAAAQPLPQPQPNLLQSTEQQPPPPDSIDSPITPLHSDADSRHSSLAPCQPSPPPKLPSPPPRGPTSSLPTAPSSHPTLSESAASLSPPPPETPESAPNALAITSAAPSSDKPSQKRKRKATDAPVPVIADLNPHDTFLQFETGWILPEGSRRGAAKAREHPTPRKNAPPAKKPRIRIKKSKSSPKDEPHELVPPQTGPSTMDVDIPPPSMNPPLSPEAGSSTLPDHPETPLPPSSKLKQRASRDRSSSLSSLSQPPGSAVSSPMSAVSALPYELPLLASETDLRPSSEPADRTLLPPTSDTVEPTSPNPPPIASSSSSRPASKFSSGSVRRKKRMLIDPETETSSGPSNSTPNGRRSGGRRDAAVAAAAAVQASYQLPVDPIEEPMAEEKPKPNGKGEEDVVMQNGTGGVEAKAEEDAKLSTADGRSAQNGKGRNGKGKLKGKGRVKVTTVEGEGAEDDANATAETEELADIWEGVGADDPALTNGTLVWAKIPGYSFFPACLVVPQYVDPTFGEIPPPESVLAEGRRLRQIEEEKIVKRLNPSGDAPVDRGQQQTKEEKEVDDALGAAAEEGKDGGKEKEKRKRSTSGREAGVTRRWLVRFYDGSSSWAWVERKGIELLGEDKALDQKMLNSQKEFKTSYKAKKTCRDAYQRSLLEMEIEEPGDAPAGVAADPVSAESPLSDAQST